MKKSAALVIPCATIMNSAPLTAAGVMPAGMSDDDEHAASTSTAAPIPFLPGLIAR